MVVLVLGYALAESADSELANSMSDSAKLARNSQNRPEFYFFMAPKFLL